MAIAREGTLMYVIRDICEWPHSITLPCVENQLLMNDCYDISIYYPKDVIVIGNYRPNPCLTCTAMKKYCPLDLVRNELKKTVRQIHGFLEWCLSPEYNARLVSFERRSVNHQEFYRFARSELHTVIEKFRSATEEGVDG